MIANEDLSDDPCPSKKAMGDAGKFSILFAITEYRRYLMSYLLRSHLDPILIWVFAINKRNSSNNAKLQV